MEKKNLGNLDKTIRIMLAVLVAALFFAEMIPESMALIVFLQARTLLLTGCVVFCPLYTAFGMSSCKRPQK